MNIPSLQNLIERAIPPQTAPRQYVLAAAAVTVMCGAASAQSAPAAPPLALLPAVELYHLPQEGEVLTLEHSPDLLQWTASPGPFFGHGEPFTFLQPITAGTPGGYFRLKLDTRPAIGNAPWALAGRTVRLSEGTSNRLLTLLPEGSGTMTTSTETLPFTWEWQRGGMDGGVLALTWPDGARTLQELEFLAVHSGVFVTRDSGAAQSAGTFLLDPAVDTPSSAPAILENVRVYISGSGRPSGLVIGELNALQRSTPFGTETCQIFYTRTGETTGVLRLANPSMQQEITLTFTGPGCGSCVTRETSAGVLRRESEGTFTVTSQP